MGSKIRDTFHNKVLEMRAMDALMDTPRFHEAMEKSTEAQLETILKSESIDKLRAWMKKVLEVSIEHWSYRRLRETGQLENVHRWSRIDRDALIEALKALGYE